MYSKMYFNRLSQLSADEMINNNKTHLFIDHLLEAVNTNQKQSTNDANGSDEFQRSYSSLSKKNRCLTNTTTQPNHALSFNVQSSPAAAINNSRHHHRFTTTGSSSMFV